MRVIVLLSVSVVALDDTDAEGIAAKAVRCMRRGLHMSRLLRDLRRCWRQLRPPSKSDSV
jgi:hypothetical protein